MGNWFKQGLKGELGKLSQYIFNLFVSISQFWNAILGGDPDETISSRCGKASRCGNPFVARFLEPLINLIFCDPTHCLDAIEEDEGGCQVWDWCKGFNEKKEKL